MKAETAEKKKIRRAKQEKLEGYLYAQLHAIGSKSEGPLYYLQLQSGKEVLIFKKVRPWENDPALHRWLGEKICVHGKLCRAEMGETIVPGMEYSWLTKKEEPLALQLKLGLEDNTLWINKMPGPHPEFPPEMKKMDLRLLVQWPYRKNATDTSSIWEGEAATSQLYDFWLEDSQGNTLWQWSKQMVFRHERTQVFVQGGSPQQVHVPWFYFEDAIINQGIYVLRARFIPSEQEISTVFNVKFAH